MSAILRATIKKGCLDEVLKDTYLDTDEWEEGEPKYPNFPEKGNFESTGFQIYTSEAEFNEFKKQKEETKIFLEENQKELKDILIHPKVEFAGIEFGIYQRNVIVQSDLFEVELLKLCVQLNLDIKLTQYPNFEEENEGKS